MKKKFSELIYNDTADESSIGKYRQNITAKWINLVESQPLTPVKSNFGSVNEHYDAMEQKDNQHHETPIETNIKQTKRFRDSDKINYVPSFADRNSNFEIKNDEYAAKYQPNSVEDFWDVDTDARYSKQKRKKVHSIIPVNKNEKVQVIQSPFDQNVKSISQCSLDIPYKTVYHKQNDLIESPLFECRENFHQQFFTTPTKHCTDNSVRHHSPQFDYMKSKNPDCVQELMKQKHNVALQSNNFPPKMIKTEYDMQQPSTPVFISSKYQVNVMIPQEKEEQQRVGRKRKYSSDEFRKDFEMVFKHRAIQDNRQTESKIGKRIFDAETALRNTEQEIENEFLPLEQNFKPQLGRFRHGNKHSSVNKCQILSEKSEQPIIFNIKCNNLIIKSD